MIEVENCLMLSKQYEVSIEASKQPVKTTEEAKKILLSSFGSKRANRLLEKKEKINMNIDVVKEQLEKTVAKNGK